MPTTPARPETIFDNEVTDKLVRIRALVQAVRPYAEAWWTDNDVLIRDRMAGPVVATRNAGRGPISNWGMVVEEHEGEIIATVPIDRRLPDTLSELQAWAEAYRALGIGEPQ